jgi:ribosomal protein S27AE
VVGFNNRDKRACQGLITMQCPKCGFDYAGLERLASLMNLPESLVRAMECPKCAVIEASHVDDLLCEGSQSVKVGSEVICADTGETGIVEHIALQDAPFRIRWPDGSADWFNGSQLRRK